MSKAKVIFGQLNPECRRPLPGIKIRKVTLEDLPAIEQLSADENFDMGLHNLELYFKTSPDTWELAENENGEVIAYNSFNLLSNGCYMGHQFLVRQDYQGKGLTHMMNVMRYFSDQLPNIGDATSDTLTRFGTHGLLGWVMQWKNIGFFGTLRSSAFSIQPRLTTVEIKPLHPSLFESLAKYDRAISPVDRSKFMKNWCLPKDSSWARTVVAVQGKKLKGFGTWRKYSRYSGICPIYADDADIAWNIMVHLLNTMELGDFLYMPVPANNATSVKFAYEIGLIPTETQTRVGTQQCYEIMEPHSLEKVYALHEYWPL